MQLNNVVSAPGVKTPNVFSTLSTMIKNEGVKAPYTGLVAGFQRQLVFGTLRISMYEPIRDTFAGKDNTSPSIGIRIAAGMTSGALAMLIASPTDLVKVRLQGDARRKPGTPARYPPGVFNVYKHIIAKEGVAALWTGVGPNIMRNCVVNAAEMAAYDQFKTTAISYGYKDGTLLHTSGGLFAGFCAVVFGSPVDVVKTRMMNARVGEYSGVFDVMKKTLAEGPLAFYKGFWANFARIGTFNTLVFVFFEQFKSLARQLDKNGSTIDRQEA